MATTKIGTLRPHARGVHVQDNAYDIMDVVTSADGIRAYMAVQNVPAGTALTDAAYWCIYTDMTTVKTEMEAAAGRADASAASANEAVNNLAGLTNEYALRVKGEIVESEGNPVAILPDEGSLIRPVTVLTPKQAGSGAPAPDNVRPISGYDALELTRCGKNLLENVAGSQSVNGLAITKNADGSMLVNGVTTAFNNFVNLTAVSESLRAIPPGKYIASGGSAVTGIAIICDSATLIEAHKDEVYFEIPETAANSWARLQVWGEGAAVNNETIFPMIRLATVEDGGYEPYQSETYSIQIGQTVYGGRMDWNTGVLSIDTVIEMLNGSEGWIMDVGGIWTGENGNSFYTTVSALGDPYAIPVCNTYKGVGRYAEDTFTENAVCIAGGGSQIEFVRTAFDTVEAWTAFLAGRYAAGTPVQIAYRLYEPTTIQFTPHQMLALKGANTLQGDGSIEVKWVKPLETSIKERTEPLIERIAALEKAILNG